MQGGGLRETFAGNLSRAPSNLDSAKLIEAGIVRTRLTLDRAIPLGVRNDAGLADPVVHGVVTVSVDP